MYDEAKKEEEFTVIDPPDFSRYLQKSEGYCREGKEVFRQDSRIDARKIFGAKQTLKPPTTMRKILLPLFLIFNLSLFAQNYVASRSMSGTYNEYLDNFDWGEGNDVKLKIFICDTLITVSDKAKSRYRITSIRNEEGELMRMKVYVAKDEKDRECGIVLGIDKEDGELYMFVFYDRTVAFCYSDIKLEIQEEKAL